MKYTCLTCVFAVLLVSLNPATADSETHLTGSSEGCFVFTDTHIKTEALEAGDVLWGDFDNDGDLDVLITGACGCKQVKIYFLRNKNGDFVPIYPAMTGVVNGTAAAADYDNDGDLDLLLTGSKSLKTGKAVTVLYRNDGDFNFSAVEKAEFLQLYHSNAAWGDYDNDGDADLLLCGRESNGGKQHTCVYENGGNDLFYALPMLELTACQDAAVEWIDFDRDGRLDIFLSGASTACYHNEGSGVFTLYPFPSAGLANADAAFGDLDNDHDVDVVLVGEEPEGEPVAAVYLNDGNGFLEKPVDLDPLYHPRLKLGDLDGDGDLDLVLTGYRTKLIVKLAHFFLYKNDGNAGFQFVFNPCLGIRDGDMDLGDCDGDGDLDVLLSGRGTLSSLAKIYRNEINIDPGLPPVPHNLSSQLLPGSIRLSWDMPVKKTAQSLPATFNVRVGTTAGGNDVVSSLSTPGGRRKIPRMGNAQYNEFFILENPSVGTYYVSVQALDHRYQGSAFTQEISFDWVPVELTAFNAVYDGNRVFLSWETASETENMGFNIYRSQQEAGGYQKINPQLIKGAGNSSVFSAYSFEDTHVQEGVYYYKLEDVDLAGKSTQHGPVRVQVTAAPEDAVLLQNYPNPFNQSTNIKYMVAHEGDVIISVFDITGKNIRRLVHRFHRSGSYDAVWDGRDDKNRDVPSGVYFVQMKSGGTVEVVKAEVVR
ncbi:T9SS type A sorting domain-containing protein [candidate division KSB1 bacterium]|nr:T9SS type A sorting domain-containing protein [candidate division KSB1 bacterium]